MKKVISIFILSTLVFFSFSQTERGRFLVGGSLTGIYDEHYADPDAQWQNKNWNLAVYPKIGYFIFNNFVVGLGFTGAWGELKQIRPDPLPATTLRSHLEGIGVFGRYYYRFDKNAFIGELYYSYDQNRDEFETWDANNPYEIARIKFNGQNNTYYGGFGYTRFMGDNLGLEIMAHFRYRYDHAVVGHNNFADDSRSFGVTLMVGFQIYLSVKKFTLKAPKAT